ncbi:hypothetical protein E5S70_10390 [Ensifer adhaerens]|nr:hypothetical protein [Ensifer canadensis]
MASTPIPRMPCLRNSWRAALTRRSRGERRGCLRESVVIAFGPTSSAWKNLPLDDPLATDNMRRCYRPVTFSPAAHRGMPFVARASGTQR